MPVETIHRRVADYYGKKILTEGPTARGVDWNSTESQQLRFTQLLRVCDSSKPFSINDIGCGYGALLDYLTEHGIEADYRGYDLSAEMIETAQKQHPHNKTAFTTERATVQPADYCVASGIYNVRLETPKPEWQEYVLDSINMLAELSQRGFAFNMLTSYSDADRMREDLYYGDPCFFFDWCKRRFSRNVALLHDYNLYEFTILVRK